MSEPMLVEERQLPIQAHAAWVVFLAAVGLVDVPVAVVIEDTGRIGHVLVFQAEAREGLCDTPHSSQVIYWRSQPQQRNGLRRGRVVQDVYF